MSSEIKQLRAELDALRRQVSRMVARQGVPSQRPQIRRARVIEAGSNVHKLEFVRSIFEEAVGDDETEDEDRGVEFIAKDPLGGVSENDLVYVALIDGRYWILSTGGGDIRGFLNGQLSSGGTAMLSVTEWDGSQWVDTGDDIAVREILGLSDPIPAGAHCYCRDLGPAGVCVISVECVEEIQY